MLQDKVNNALGGLAVVSAIQNTTKEPAIKTTVKTAQTAEKNAEGAKKANPNEYTYNAEIPVVGQLWGAGGAPGDATATFSIDYDMARASAAVEKSNNRRAARRMARRAGKIYMNNVKQRGKQ